MLTALITALVLGILIAVLYKLYAPVGGNFAVTLAVLPLLVASVILIVNGNLGTSVAVLGAFGLVRFRSAAGTAQEIGYLFFAMAVGLAAGMGFLTLAVLITVLAGGAILGLERTGFAFTNSRERMLRITIPEDLNYGGLFDDLLMAYTSRSALERVRTVSMGTLYELTYRVVLRRADREKELIDALRTRNGNLTVTLGIVPREKNEL